MVELLLVLLWLPMISATCQTSSQTDIQTYIQTYKWTEKYTTINNELSVRRDFPFIALVLCGLSPERTRAIKGNFEILKLGSGIIQVTPYIIMIMRHFSER